MSTKERPWALVAARELRVKLTDRNFLISTGITLALILGLLGVQAFLASRDDAPEYVVAVTSADGKTLVGEAEQVLRQNDKEASLSATSVADTDAGSAVVADEDADAVLARADEVWTLTSDGGVASDLQQAMAEAVRFSVLSANAEVAGASLPDLMVGTEMQVENMSGEQEGAQQVLEIVAGLVFAMLFYLASLIFGLSIAQSVVEEKQSRIVEILAAVIPVRALLTGKVLGNTVLAFAQMALIVGVSLIGLSFTEYDQFLPMLNEPLLWYFPFFVAGFVALACVWAAAGALASRVEDLQSTTMPLTLSLVLIFVLALNLDGVGRQIGSFVPVLSTILMPMRLLEGQAAWWEPVLALAVTLAFCYITIIAGSTLYRRALMQTQGRVTLRQAMSMRG